MWYQDLNESDAYYLEVIETNMIAHFRASCSSLNVVNVIIILGEMMEYFGQTEGISQYINTMYASQARAKQTNLPISN